MNDSDLLVNAATRIFRDFYKNDLLNKARRDGWCAELWEALEQAGMTLISVPDELGGSGGTVIDAAEVLRLAGKYCASIPLAETAVLGGWALSGVGIEIPKGPLGFRVVNEADDLKLVRDGDHWRISGHLNNVPWARHASALVIILSAGRGAKVILATSGTYRLQNQSNIAGEARDSVIFNDAIFTDNHVRDAVNIKIVDEALQRGALARAIQMSGALERILEVTLEYAKQRSQFGKPIIKFQAVQQELAKLAGDAAIAKASAMAAAACVQVDRGANTSVAIAKIKAGEAAQSGASIAHQLHGAIGVTDEYVLHHSTLRLWAWRSEYGSETKWAEKLGAYILSSGAITFWDKITEGSMDEK